MAMADGNPRDAGSDIIFQQFYLASTSQSRIIKRYSRRHKDDQLCRLEELVNSMQLASGTLSDHRTHGILLSRTWTEANTHVASDATSSMCDANAHESADG
ncbi:Uncharacterized protein DBV15_11015 [Temnothorax longispinosus]|uniref:Uncharacterized protein n=1 Tax=Temnothorax longispinosus TaxID=300112 RepID=A0A4S2KPN6_9HYME|nr:Uncharacterized protein DBV15_11015 [Temnothorax longispinosus]